MGIRTVTGTGIGRGNAEQQVHCGSGSCNRKFLYNFRITKTFGSCQLVQSFHTDVGTFVHIGNVDPPDLLHQPTLADTGVALHGDGDLLDIQLIKHITGR